MNRHFFAQRLFLALAFIMASYPGDPIWAAESSSEKIAKEDQAVVKIIEQNNCNAFRFDASALLNTITPEMKLVWNLGDGMVANQAVVDHTYQKAGEYKVQLTVNDGADLQKKPISSFQNIHVSVPPAVILKAPDKVCVHEKIRLDVQGKDALEPSLKYIWDLGDGTQGTGRFLQKKYDQPGHYTIRLTTLDRSRNFCAQSIIEKDIYVNRPPQANAGEDVNLQCLARPIDFNLTFDASASMDREDDSLEYFWDFGDGTGGQGQIVDHRYKKDGRYQVRLTVRDQSGLSCNSSTDTLEVNLARGVEAKGGGDVYACVGENISFDGSASYGPQGALFVQWDFGDGSHEPGLQLTHRYNQEGIYQATLTVEDPFQSRCAEVSDSRLVVVKQSPRVTIESVGDGYSGEEIFFQALVSYPALDELEYFWSFGDGTVIRGGPITSHRFYQAGTYQVSMIVDQNEQSQCSSSSDRMTIHVRPAREVE